MKVLLTGASSFTGAWFARALAEDDHEVVATFQRGDDSYDGVRAERVALVADVCSPVYECAFGSDRMLQVLGDGGFDALCHHAADVRDYKSADFDFAAALANNTQRLRAVLAAFRDGGGGRVIATGSVFENDEGAGEEPRRAFSPYGLSKSLSYLAMRHFADEAGLALGKFVIPNPFGPLEEPRFTDYLVRTWTKGETARVATPSYLRDNIHVRLLAATYADFVAHMDPDQGEAHFGPCGYVETQGAFAQRFAEAMRPRLGLTCALELATQTDFPEPMMRVNTDVVYADEYEFDEIAAWDELADYYRRRHLDGTS